MDLSNDYWSDIEVPSNWELQGFGETHYPQYTICFSPNPPYIDVENPVGTYRKTFTVPSDWQNKEVMLHFGSINGLCTKYT